MLQPIAPPPMMTIRALSCILSAASGGWGHDDEAGVKRRVSRSSPDTRPCFGTCEATGDLAPRESRKIKQRQLQAFQHDPTAIVQATGESRELRNCTILDISCTD